MAEREGVAEIISVGNELLSGRTVNTNASFLSSELQKLGFAVKHVQTVADDENDIFIALRSAVTRAQVILLSGGLGPTDDDITRETVAKALGMPLRLDEEVLADITAFFESRGRQMEENNRKQAMVPAGARALKNDNGTAPGLYIGTQKQAIVLLPGPPYELQPLFTDKVRPLLMELGGKVIRTCALGVTGTGESELETELHDLLYAEDAHCALYAVDGEVSVTVSVTGEDEETCDRLLEEKKQALKEVLGDRVYSENGDDLCHAVVGMLSEEGKKVALAESCTGGMMAQMITAIPGSSSVFEYGLASYSDWVKATGLDIDRDIIHKYSAVSSVVAGEMARSARRNGRADFGVGITGLAGPGNAGYYDKSVGDVFIGVASKDKTVVKAFRFGDRRNRDNIRRLSVINAFDMLRRVMKGLPVEDGHEFGKKEFTDINAEKPKKKAGLFFRRALSMVLIAAVAGSGLYYGVNKTAAAVRRNTYLDLSEQYAAVVEDQGSEAVARIHEEHKNIIGWVSNTDGLISTPVVRGRGDNYYLTRDFDGNSNSLGCTAVKAGTALSERPVNLIVNSLCSEEGIMLGSLTRYLDRAYAQENGTFRFTGLDFIQDYRLMSVMLLDPHEEMDNVLLTSSFVSEEDARNFLINAKMRSIFENGERVTIEDNFLTLSVDLSKVPGYWEGARLVVVGVAVDREDAEKTLELEPREDAVYPDCWYEVNHKASNVNKTAEADKWLEWVLGGNNNNNNNSGVIGHKDRKITVSMNGEDFTATPAEVVSYLLSAKIVDFDCSDESIRALAIAIATELKYNMINSVEVYDYEGRAPEDGIQTIVEAVIDKAVTYNGQLCWTPSYRCNGGYTNSAKEMYGFDMEYLTTVESECDYLLGEDGYRSTKEINKDILKELLEVAFGISLSDDYQNWIKPATVTTAGYVSKVSLDGQLNMSGEMMYVTTLGLSSSNVELTWNYDTAVFTCYGTGDGVGYSVYGAKKYQERSGCDYASLLAKYFPGTAVTVNSWDDFYID